MLFLVKKKVILNFLFWFQKVFFYCYVLIDIDFLTNFSFVSLQTVKYNIYFNFLINSVYLKFSLTKVYFFIISFFFFKFIYILNGSFL